MADITLGWKVRTDVIGIDRSGVVGFMAGEAFRRETCGCTRVTEIARRIGVCTGERKRRDVVIETCRFPCVGCVAGGAIVIEAGERMVGIVGVAVILLVAHEAF